MHVSIIKVRNQRHSLTGEVNGSLIGKKRKLAAGNQRKGCLKREENEVKALNLY